MNAKQDTIGNGDLTIAYTNGLQTALNAKQNTIQDGDLTIAKTSGLQTSLNNKANQNTTYTKTEVDIAIANLVDWFSTRYIRYTKWTC